MNCVWCEFPDVDLCLDDIVTHVLIEEGACFEPLRIPKTVEAFLRVPMDPPSFTWKEWMESVVDGDRANALGKVPRFAGKYVGFQTECGVVKYSFADLRPIFRPSTDQIYRMRRYLPYVEKTIQMAEDWERKIKEILMV